MFCAERTHYCRSARQRVTLHTCRFSHAGALTASHSMCPPCPLLHSTRFKLSTTPCAQHLRTRACTHGLLAARQRGTSAATQTRPQLVAAQEQPTLTKPTQMQRHHARGPAQGSRAPPQASPRCVCRCRRQRHLLRVLRSAAASGQHLGAGRLLGLDLLRQELLHLAGARRRHDAAAAAAAVPAAGRAGK